jgi:lysophospholipase L1-like esterase
MKSLKASLQSSRFLWIAIGCLSVLTTSLFIFGFGYSIKTILYPQPSDLSKAPSAQIEEPVKSDREIVILALGDSLTKGTGDPTSKGYIGHVAESVRQDTEQPIKLINFAVDGYRTGQLLEDIRTQNGVVSAIKQADMITLTIGANDLFSIGEEVDIVASGAQLTETIIRIEQILSEIKDLNADADLFYVGLYNPFIELEQADLSSLFVQEFNHHVFKIINQYPHMTLVPTFDLFANQVSAYLSSDQYHPNEQGYLRIAERIIQSIHLDSEGE